MPNEPVVSTNFSPLPTTIASVPEITITGGVLLHCGPPTPENFAADHKKKGYKIIWVLTKDEMKEFTPLADEMTFRWDSEAQIRRLFHDQMHLWTGALILPQCERQMKLAEIMVELADLHNFNERSNTVLSKDDLPTRNAFRNYKWYEDGLPLARLRDRGKGGPTVIVAAGPSLNGQWAHLRALRAKWPNAPFIVCGRSYKKAMMEGVFPQFVVEVEQYDWDAELFMFAPEPPDSSVLVFPCTAAPRLAKVWPALKLCLLNHNLAKLMGLEVGVESVDGGNSVLHYAMILANIVGSNPIYLAGVDFGYPKGRAEDTHADGTFHPWGTDTLMSEHTHQEGGTAEANDGQAVMTSGAYKNFGTYLSVQIERAKLKMPDLKVLSFSRRGMKIAGVEYTDIEELLK
jgi:hypothetical protein